MPSPFSFLQQGKQLYFLTFQDNFLLWAIYIFFRFLLKKAPSIF